MVFSQSDPTVDTCYKALKITDHYVTDSSVSMLLPFHISEKIFDKYL